MLHDFSIERWGFLSKSERGVDDMKNNTLFVRLISFQVVSVCIIANLVITALNRFSISARVAEWNRPPKLSRLVFKEGINHLINLITANKQGMMDAQATNLELLKYACENNPA